MGVYTSLASGSSSEAIQVAICLTLFAAIFQRCQEAGIEDKIMNEFASIVGGELLQSKKNLGGETPSRS